MDFDKQHDQILVSIIIPVFNEEAVIPEMRKRFEALVETLPVKSEIICIDDGSKDQSFPLLMQWAESNPIVKVGSFSRNFGHQFAITAGLDLCKGDAAVTIDADLQDPPELIGEMVKKFLEGYDVVFARRVRRAGEGWFKKGTAYLFYRFMQKAVHRDLPTDVGDFRLISKPIIDILRQMREKHRFLRGMVAWIGFKQTFIPYERQTRFAGSTHYPINKMMALAWNAIISFSVIPLRVIIVTGVGIACMGFLYGIYAIYHAFILKDTVPGWTSVVTLLSIFSGFIMICLGILGEYIGRIFEEVKGRPLYTFKATANIEVARISNITLLQNARARYR